MVAWRPEPTEKKERCFQPCPLYNIALCLYPFITCCSTATGQSRIECRIDAGDQVSALSSRTGITTLSCHHSRSNGQVRSHAVHSILDNAPTLLNSFRQTTDKVRHPALIICQRSFIRYGEMQEAPDLIRN